MDDMKKYKELGDFLRTRRERLLPAEAGLNVRKAGRRTPGLRREEVSTLSGVSLAWYTYLEQGRPIHASSEVLESLARTLKLNNEERRYLFELAGQAVPSGSAVDEDEGTETVPKAAQLILNEMNHYPAYIVSARLNVVAWNKLASQIFGPFEETSDLERNLLWRMFTRKDYRRLFIHWEYMAKSLLAQFRSFYGKHMYDPWLNSLADKLTEASKEFKDWWLKHDVDGIPDGNKEINHPRLGMLKMSYTNLLLADKQNMVLTVFIPQAGSDTEKKLSQLL